MANIQILVGSVMGTAIFTAEELSASLSDLGHDIAIDPESYEQQLSDPLPDVLIVCTSSTGNGELPEQFHNLYKQWQESPPNIAGLKYLIVALGDTSYEDFCGAGKLVQAQLNDIGAVEMAPMLEIDGGEVFDPEIVATQWVQEQLEGV